MNPTNPSSSDQSASSSEPSTDPVTSAGPQRKCSRCRELFPCPLDEVSTGPAEWWLCEPCHLALIGADSYRKR